ncbi:FG-GAP repeat domain-containing protein [Streptomyces sp. NPDC057438]|uniref:FG-GAP repeat domain-containing protein n=1 Tax=Streptomyces sp. NPDC057438 TaxID=3346133 RepID=UPI0036CFBA5B
MAVLLVSVAVAVWQAFGDDISAAGTDSATVLPGTAPVRGERVPGDFDGDGQKDLAVVENTGTATDERHHIRVLYGPFTREGEPRRTGEARPNPIFEAGLVTSDTSFSLTAGDADGDRATDLVVTSHLDGEQEPSVLLHGGGEAGGFDPRARYLRTGSSVAFGDFDGDGKGDIAVGDSGGRNNEPEADPQDPTVHDTVTVYYGGDRPDERLEPGTNGSYSTADVDHDGQDELLISSEGGVEVLRGSTAGLVVKDGSGGVQGWTVGAAITAAAGAVLLAVGYRRRKASSRSGSPSKAPWWARFEGEPRPPAGQ